MDTLTTVAGLASGALTLQTVLDENRGEPDVRLKQVVADAIKDLKLMAPSLVRGMGSTLSVRASGLHSHVLVLNGKLEDGEELKKEQVIFMVKREMYRITKKEPTHLAIVNMVNAFMLGASLYTNSYKSTLLVICSLMLVLSKNAHNTSIDRNAEKYALKNSSADQIEKRTNDLKDRCRELKKQKEENSGVHVYLDLFGFVNLFANLVLKIFQLLLKDNGDYIWTPYLVMPLSERITTVESFKTK